MPDEDVQKQLIQILQGMIVRQEMGWCKENTALAWAKLSKVGYKKPMLMQGSRLLIELGKSFEAFWMLRNGIMLMEESTTERDMIEGKTFFCNGSRFWPYKYTSEPLEDHYMSLHPPSGLGPLRAYLEF